MIKYDYSARLKINRIVALKVLEWTMVKVPAPVRWRVPLAQRLFAVYQDKEVASHVPDFCSSHEMAMALFLTMEHASFECEMQKGGLNCRWKVELSEPVKIMNRVVGYRRFTTLNAELPLALCEAFLASRQIIMSAYGVPGDGKGG